MKLAHHDHPFAARTVLVSSSEESQVLVELLTASGIGVLVLPSLAITGPQSYRNLDQAIEDLFGYDWLLFRSEHAADFFLRRFQELNHDLGELDSLRVCALDELTKNKLLDQQVHIDLYSKDLQNRRIISLLREYVAPNELRALNFLVPGAAVSADKLTEELADTGARVDVIPTYQVRSGITSSLERLRALILGGGIDAIGFTSPGDLRTLATLFDANDLAVILGGISIACLDDSTAQALSKFNLSVEVMATQSTYSGLSDALVANLESSSSRT